MTEMNLKYKFERHYDGLHWTFENERKETLSIINHFGSYGNEVGLFEVMPSWRNPTKGDSVKGYMTFGEVQKFINELASRENVLYRFWSRIWWLR